MTIVSALSGHRPTAPAIVSDGQRISYGELLEASNATRAGLRELGLGIGDRVGIVCSNTTSSVVSLLAVLGAGMVAVPINPGSPPNERERELEQVGADLLLTGAPVDGETAARLATPAGVTVEGIDPLPAGSDRGTVAVDAGDLAVMLFTSGTAGPPKPAMLSHASLEAVQSSIIDHPASDVDTNAVNLAVLPLAHVYGLNISLLTTLRAGGTVVLLPRFSAEAVAEAIMGEKVTHFAGVPPMWRALIDTPSVSGDTFAGVLRVTSGAAALPITLYEEFQQRFGVKLSEGYGLTETASGATSHLGVEIRPGSVGKALPGVELKVVDYDDNPAPFDDSGIVKVRGANVFSGYWDDEEATKSVLDDDGWLRTGDIGVLSEDGYLSLVDRAKDLIIVSGFNVYPFEVEAVLVAHPAIEAAIVVGRYDDRRGEGIVAYATVAAGQAVPSLEDVNTFCSAELARYKLPSELRIVDELPIAASGKPIRRELA